MESIRLAGRRTWLALSAACLLVACGSAPVVRSQKTVDTSTARLTRVLFFYQETTLTSQRVSGKGDVTASADETGLARFGEAMVARAAPAFQKNGIVVTHAAVVPAGQWKPFARTTFTQLGPNALQGATLVTVEPRGGQARATPNAATVAVTFEVRVVDATSERVVWDGMVDTSTWKGRDFLTKNVEGNRYDEAYADQFLELVIATLRNNGLV